MDVKCFSGGVDIVVGIDKMFECFDYIGLMFFVILFKFW